MNHSPNRILRKFFNIGIAQIVPVVLAILFIVIMLGSIISLVIYDPFNSITIGQPNSPNSQEILFIFVFSFVSIFCLSGLFAFLFSTYRFIQAKNRMDYDYIIKGMYSLDWGWFVLTLFTVISSLLTLLALLFYS